MTVDASSLLPGFFGNPEDVRDFMRDVPLCDRDTLISKYGERPPLFPKSLMDHFESNECKKGIREKLAAADVQFQMLADRFLIPERYRETFLKDYDSYSEAEEGKAEVGFDEPLVEATLDFLREVLEKGGRFNTPGKPAVYKWLLPELNLTVHLSENLCSELMDTALFARRSMEQGFYLIQLARFRKEELQKVLADPSNYLAILDEEYALTSTLPPEIKKDFHCGIKQEQEELERLLKEIQDFLNIAGKGGSQAEALLIKIRKELTEDSESERDSRGYDFDKMEGTSRVKAYFLNGV